MNMDMDKLSIAERAAERLLRLETADLDERAPFWDWCRESPLHAAEVLAITATHTALSHLFRNRGLDPRRLVREAANIHELERRQRAQRAHGPRMTSRRRFRARLRVARAAFSKPHRAAPVIAILLAALSSALVVLRSVPGQTLATSPGEWRTMILDDGTVVRSGPGTELRAAFTDHQRTVRLTRGEGLFEVAGNAARPFVVDTDFVSARAIGAAFAVSWETAERVAVTVREGAVDVTARISLSRPTRAGESRPSITLRAGEQVVIHRTRGLTQRRVDVDLALAWASGRLIFYRATATDAVHEFNRRNRRQIRLLNPAPGGGVVSGVFSAADPESFVAYLERQGARAVLDDAVAFRLLSEYPREDDGDGRRKPGIRRPELGSSVVGCELQRRSDVGSPEFRL